VSRSVRISGRASRAFPAGGDPRLDDSDPLVRRREKNLLRAVLRDRRDRFGEPSPQHGDHDSAIVG